MGTETAAPAVMDIPDRAPKDERIPKYPHARISAKAYGEIPRTQAQAGMPAGKAAQSCRAESDGEEVRPMG